MISENPAVKLEDGTKVCRHTVEVLCPNCGRDVDEAELAAQKCNDCGFVLVGLDHRRAAHSDLARTIGCHQRQLKAVGDLFETVFNSNACHGGVLRIG